MKLATGRTCIQPLLAAVLVLGGFSFPDCAKAQEDFDFNRCNYTPRENILLEIDATGFADWRYTNPRSPYPVVDKTCELSDDGPTQDEIIRKNQFDAQWDETAPSASVRVRNTASGQAAVLSIPYTYEFVRPQEAVTLLQERLARASSSYRAAETAKRDPAKTTDESVEIPGLCSEPDDPSCPTEAVLDNFNKYIEELADIAGEEPSDDQDGSRSEYLAKAAEGSQLLSELSMIRDEIEDALKPEPGPKPPSQPETAPQTSRVPRSAATTLHDSLQRLETALIRAVAILQAASEPEPSIAECPEILDRQSCAWSHTLYAGESVVLSDDLWNRLVRSSRGTLKIELSFFDERNIVSNSAAYLRVKSRVAEPDNVTDWKLAGDIGAVIQPELDRDLADGLSGFFTTESPYDDGRRQSYSASAKLTLTQQLGSIAKARVIGQFKGGDLGEAETTRDFVVPEYEVSLFGSQGLTFRYGKTNFAAPASGIAVRESGEGFESTFRWLSLAHLMKRESLTGVPDDADDDSEVDLLRFRFRPRGGTPVQIVEATALYGKDRQEDRTSYTYWTMGFEGFTGSLIPGNGGKRLSNTWRFAYFYSERDADEGDKVIENGGEEDESKAPVVQRIEDGRGGVWIVDGSFSWLPAVRSGVVPKSLRSFTLTFAGGDGDDPDTPLDEGYVGETSSFAPDRLFLSGLAGALREPLVEVAPAEPEGESSFRLGRQVIRPSLSNKHYLGVSWIERNLTHLFSPLHLIARLSGVSHDIVDQAFTLSAHVYRFDKEVLGSRDAGQEIDLRFEIQVPRGVKSSLELGMYFPGEATEQFFEEDPFFVRTGISVTL